MPTCRGFAMFMFTVLPLLLAVLVSWKRPDSNDWDAIFSEGSSPALELLQREAKLVQVVKKIDSAKKLDSVHNKTLHNKQDNAHSQDLSATTKTTTASAFGIGANGVGNLPTFIVGLCTDFCVIALCIFIFWYYSHRYPMLYGRGNIKSGMAKSNINGLTVDPENMTLFGWAAASWRLTTRDVWEAAGLDKALMLRFSELCIRSMTIIAIPMFFITGPLNCWFGGNAAGQDHESWFSLGNVRFYSWLYWVTGLACCFVGYVICNMCHKGMRELMLYRNEWLLTMNDCRARTLMMTGVPPQYRNDQKCKDFWNMILPGKVESVNLTKDTSQNLVRLVGEREAARLELDAAKTAVNDVDRYASDYRARLGLLKDRLNECHNKVNGLEKDVRDERDRIDARAKAQNPLDPDNLNLGTGFITFKDRVAAECAFAITLGDDIHTWVIDHAPEPADIIWADFTEDETAGGARAMVGYALTLGVMIIYMPLVVAIANIAEAINLGPFQMLWSSEAPSIGLTIMVDFLPTILVLIFTNSFSVYDRTAQQYKLTVWYFWMNILFVVLVTALGTSFLSFVKTLANDPLKVFHLFATTMPNCTHYYMNYLGMQWYSMAMQLTRYMNLIKFKVYIKYHDDDKARELSEPEDQDYYGIGSRTARFSTLMTIAIVYGTLSPPCSVLGLLTMIWIRTLFGYIFVWNEVRKPDLGGVFFQRALVNMYIALHVYFILMLGVLYIRGNDCVPAVIAACGWVYVMYSHHKFTKYKWEHVQVNELFTREYENAKRHYLHGKYKQPELYDDDVVGLGGMKSNAERIGAWAHGDVKASNMLTDGRYDYNRRPQ